MKILRLYVINCFLLPSSSILFFLYKILQYCLTTFCLVYNVAMKSIEKFQQWLNQQDLPMDLKEELEIMKTNSELCNDAFYTDLEFGTAGIRGVIGAGTNRMNIFTVSRATQGLCAYLKNKTAYPKVAIAYDSRNMSLEFAQTSALCLAEGGCKVYLYDKLVPTPMLSYAVRNLHTDAGIVITASHNPAKYNGYKVYDSTGCQISTEVAEEISLFIAKADMFKKASYDFEHYCQNGSIEYIKDTFIENYYKAVLSQSIKQPQTPIDVVYTPLNGTGNLPVREVLKRLGNINVTVVSQQELPDKNFTTCTYPNPENKEAMQLAVDLMKEKNADFCLATDPDCDRVGTACLDNEGNVVFISGNEMGAMLLEFICEAKSKEGTLPENPIAVKTVVTTPMAQAVDDYYGVETVNVLTGFKYIGEIINKLEEKNEEHRFIFGYEESCGYLSGGFVRDKDAVNACMLICEMASYYKSQGKSLVDIRNSLFDKYGCYKSEVLNTAFEGELGMHNMADILERLRATPPKSFADKKVICTVDYKFDNTGLPKSNVLEYKLEDKCSVIIRPSGTEPKLKMYITSVGKTPQESECVAEEIKKSCKELTNI